MLRLADYQGFLAREADSIAQFRARQRRGFDAERERWIATGQAHFEEGEVAPDVGEDEALGQREHAIESHIAGNLWQVCVVPGQTVRAGETLAILESMKMEIPLTAPRDGIVKDVRLQPGAAVRAGQRVLVLEET